WDDTYKFINDKNDNYIQTILKGSSIFKKFNIDFNIILASLWAVGELIKIFKYV
ncbi:hypothetical protein JTT01_11625, partial [Clostridium botulinum]|nr:hypothetical protein [Clostridium botulinum]